jgi:hypothetical protein
LSVSFARDNDVVVRCAIRRSIRAIPCAEEFEESVGLAERDHLALAKLANKSLSAERRSAHQSAERRLGSLPQLENIGGSILRFPRAIEPNCNRLDGPQGRQG